MLLMLAAVASTGSPDSSQILGSIDMRVLANLVPFMDICAPHCRGCFGGSSNKHYTSFVHWIV